MVRFLPLLAPPSPRTMTLTFFSFLITGVPSFRPRTPAIPGIYLFSHTGCWRDVVPFTLG